MEKLLHTRPEAAEMLGVSLRKIDTLLARGAIRPTRIDGSVRFSREELERIAREGTDSRSPEVSSEILPGRDSYKVMKNLGAQPQPQRHPGT